MVRKIEEDFENAQIWKLGLREEMWEITKSIWSMWQIVIRWMISLVGMNCYMIITS